MGLADIELQPISNGISDDPEDLQRTGSTWTATAHIITGVIGAGVLSLAWSTAQLGWILGPIAIIIFALITLVATLLVTECYRSPDPSNGPIRHKSFSQAVNFYLGKKHERICRVFVLESLCGCAVAYAIVTGSCVKAILRSNCYHKDGHQAKCDYKENTYMILFGLTQIIVSQIPDFHKMAWLSVIAAIMSFTYASIGFGLAIATVVVNGRIKGSIGGITTDAPSQKIWLIFQALGDIAFSYPITQIILEIQDTLKSPPPENRSMRKATTASVIITTFFYLCCGCFGYAAFGNDTPGNLLTGFGFYEPFWLVDFANACIILHLVGGYQVFSQPVFAFGEKWFTEKYPQNKFINKFYTCQVLLLPKFQLNLLRICFRTLYVVTMTGIALIFPYFNQILGVLGALNFWPLAIYFPVEMYFAQFKIGKWTRKWIGLQVFSMGCLILSLVGLIGSIEGLVRAKFK